MSRRSARRLVRRDGHADPSPSSRGRRGLRAAIALEHGDRPARPGDSTTAFRRVILRHAPKRGDRRRRRDPQERRAGEVEWWFGGDPPDVPGHRFSTVRFDDFRAFAEHALRRVSPRPVPGRLRRRRRTDCLASPAPTRAARWPSSATSTIACPEILEVMLEIIAHFFESILLPSRARLRASPIRAICSKLRPRRSRWVRWARSPTSATIPPETTRIAIRRRSVSRARSTCAPIPTPDSARGRRARLDRRSDLTAGPTRGSPPASAADSRFVLRPP